MESHVTKQVDRWREVGWLGRILGTFLLAGLALWVIVSLGIWGDGFGPEAWVASQRAFAEETGVRVIRVAVIAGGGMLDLRYQVVDPDKAVIVHDQERPPTLVHEATGQAVSRPWHDHSHDTELHSAVTYYELIMNPEGMIQSGDQVSIMIGDSRLEHVVVQ